MLIDTVNIVTQRKGESIDVVIINLKELIKNLEDMRDNDFNKILNECREVARNAEFVDTFKTVGKRGRKR